MDDVLIALHFHARRYRGGICALARELGKREKTLLSKLDPADDTHQPTIGEFAALLHRLDEPARVEILERFTGMFGLALATRHAGLAESVTQAVLHSISEHADIVREVERALEDGEICEIERDRILRECGEARRALTVLENTLRRRGGKVA